MKNILFIFLFLLHIKTLIGQWESGYVIKNNGDTLKGEISIPQIVKNKQVDFRNGKDKHLFLPTDIKGYKKGEMEFKSLLIPDYTHALLPIVWNPDKDEGALGHYYFVRIKQKGALNLLEYRFILNDIETPAPYYILYKTNKAAIVSKRWRYGIWRNNITLAVALMTIDKPEFVKKFAKIKFKDLPIIVKEYNIPF